MSEVQWLRELDVRLTVLEDTINLLLNSSNSTDSKETDNVSKFIDEVKKAEKSTTDDFDEL